MCSTVFGAVTNSGRIEIWDLSFSVLDPIIVHQVMDRKLTCINFSKLYPVVLISDDGGNVNIYKLKNFNYLSSKSFNEQVNILQNIIVNRNEISSLQNNNNNNMILTDLTDQELKNKVEGDVKTNNLDVTSNVNAISNYSITEKNTENVSSYNVATEK
ncbi:hypothetical protein PIROE2DRAFT_5858 [Piromyces sp. E2]|nr:hypothetical protein PIROE2DRAFT_5858 [Piromyces sp. E2]|eukprot:OUM66874.1 hypothetical protein PIROE2DRAFT_5858 [Piromyces sp. E2]